MAMEIEREQSEAFKEDPYFRKHSLGWLLRRSRVDHHFIEWWSPRGIHQSHSQSQMDGLKLVLHENVPVC